MRILVTGGYGFIGSQVTATLSAAGHEVILGVRNKEEAMRRFPNNASIYCNFIEDTDPEIWLPRLSNIDVVVNCVGILQSRDSDVIDAIHNKTPRALISACIKANVKKFIHISALGAEEGLDVPYAKTKLAFEHYLQDIDYDWIVLRPSLVYGPGVSGGTALFRALASTPWLIPVVGDGKQLFQPIHIRDLSEAILILAEKSKVNQKRINAVGPEALSLESILISLRRWLGFGEGKVVHIPLDLMRGMAYIGDWFKEIPINSTSFKMLRVNNVADVSPFIDAVGFQPATMEENLMMEPSSVQDRWHARLYFLSPLLRIALGLLWLFSGLIPLLLIPQYALDFMMAKAGLFGTTAKVALYASTGFNILLGLLTLANWHIKLIGSIQILTIIAYTLVFTFIMPIYWLDPMGGYIKNIPLLVATLVMMAMSEER